MIDDDDNIINFPNSNPVDEKHWVEKTISHPCEDVFNIEPNSTVMTIPAPRNTELVESPLYDEKDKELETDFQEIYDACMDAFDTAQEEMEGIEGKYKARNNEVAVMFLNTALAAAKEKSRLKEHKDKLKVKPVDIGPGGVTNNTQVNITSAELVRMLVQQQSPINNLGDTSVNVVEPSEPTPPPARKAIPRRKKVEEPLFPEDPVDDE